MATFSIEPNIIPSATGFHRIDSQKHILSEDGENYISTLLVSRDIDGILKQETVQFTIPLEACKRELNVFQLFRDPTDGWSLSYKIEKEVVRKKTVTLNIVHDKK